MSVWDRIRGWWRRREEPEPQRRGRLGEAAVRTHLERNGLRFLTANFRSRRGEIDLVFRDGDCLVFVEVKTRSSEKWGRPASAVDHRKRHHLTRAALDYLRRLRDPRVKVRFDVVEVLVEDDRVAEIRHLPGAFTMVAPHRYG